MSVICKDVKMAFKTAAGSVNVLKGVDFTAPAGMLTMLVGPSGCGKTTLISLIAGLLRGASGSMQVFGHEVSSMSASMRFCGTEPARLSKMNVTGRSG